MTKICRAEAILTPEREVTPEILASARLTGILAAKKAWEIIPLAGSIRPLKTEIAIDVAENGTRIIASVEADGGGEASALLAATAAALCFNDLARGTLESVRPIDQIEETAQSTPYPRKPATPPARRGVKPAPATLMGEVVGPKAPATGSSSKREAFRAFMLSHHLRATEWAKKANIPAALIYSYLTGRSASIPPDVLAALAKVAKVKPDDMFKI